MKVNVLGTEYEVIRDTLRENDKYENCGGYVDCYKKEIHVRKHTHDDADFDNMALCDESMILCENQCLRHELMHAFMYESGLDANSNFSDSWATNEEMIDWIAIQMPKITAAYDSVVNKD